MRTMYIVGIGKNVPRCRHHVRELGGLINLRPHVRSPSQDGRKGGLHAMILGPH